nr:hypothetical protein [Herbidospora sakaeratensis]
MRRIRLLPAAGPGACTQMGGVEINYLATVEVPQLKELSGDG